MDLHREKREAAGDGEALFSADVQAIDVLGSNGRIRANVDNVDSVDLVLEMLEGARADIAADVEAARGDLETEADRLSEMIAERLLGRSLTSEAESEK